MASDYFGRFKRSVQLDKENSWVFGVCAGLANFFRQDPAVIRVAVVVCGLFFPKTVAAAYLIAWLVLDDRDTPLQG